MRLGINTQPCFLFNSISNNYTMQAIKYITLLAFLVLISCAEKNSTPTSTDNSTLLELLSRNTAIQNGKEWETIQNYYAKNRLKLSEKPDDLEARLELAQLFVQEARITGEHGHYYPAALRMTDEILQLAPSDKDILFMTLVTKAGVQLSQHDFAAALETGEKAVTLNPYNAQVYGTLVDAYVELGNYSKAVEMADKMVSIRPDLRSYSRVSYLREIHGKIDGAIEAMKLAVSAGAPGQEQTAWTRLTLGNLYQTYGNLEQAAQEYQIILQERPNYPFALAALAEVEMAKENYQEVERLLNEAKNIIPEVGFYEQLAHLYQKTNRMAEAKSTIKEIFTMLEDDVVHGHNMNLEYAAIHRDLTGNYEEALKYAQADYEKRPNNIDVNKLMASILLKQGKAEAAVSYLQQAKVTNSQHPELLAIQTSLNQ